MIIRLQEHQHMHVHTRLHTNSAVARQAAKYQQQLAQVQAENTRLVQQLQNRDQTEKDLRETLDILRLKVAKLEQLLKLKNTKIAAMDKQLKQLTL